MIYIYIYAPCVSILINCRYLYGTRTALYSIAVVDSSVFFWMDDASMI